VDDVSFRIEEGKTLGLVGESGSGKSTLSRALLKLQPVTAGEAYYAGKEIFGMSESEFRPLRKEVQMVFQDPFGSLNPTNDGAGDHRRAIGDSFSPPHPR